MVDVKVDSIQFRPNGILAPETRVHKDRKPLVFRQIVRNLLERCSPLPTESAAEIIPVLISRTGETTKIIACMAIGAKRRATSERKTTPVNTRREIARSSLDSVGDVRDGVFGIKKERATLTGMKHRVRAVVHGGVTHAPGNNANIFGSVRPIQNGRWDCVQVSKVHRNPVGLPNQRDTARRTRIRPKALIVASTSRTTRCSLSRRIRKEQCKYYSPMT